MSTDLPVHTVKKLNERIRALVERETLDKVLKIGGIVRSTYYSDSGHIYFTLEDDGFSIRCMLSRAYQGDIGFTPQNNMEVEITGVIRVFEQQARIEFSVEDMQLIEPSDTQDLQSARAALEAKRLLPKDKKPLPAEINHITLVTSKTSRAYDDFIENYRRKQGQANTDLRDVLLEGQHAPQHIADAITHLNQQGTTDVIVLTRGGGRRQMLRVFDDLLIAEAICRSNIPIVTGIGHERDQTFADEIADYRLSTPTEAAIFLAKPPNEDEQTDMRYIWIGAGIIAAIVIIGLLLVLLT